MSMGSLTNGWDRLSHAPANSPGVVEAVVGGVEVAVGTPGTVGTSAVCELVSWSVAGSGVIWVVGTVGTVETDVVCVSVSWSLQDQGLSG